MAEHIERELIYSYFEKCNDNNPKWTPGRVKTLIAWQPAADVGPVWHGRWDVKVGMNFFRERICTVCKKRIESNFWGFRPNCGAKMDLKGE